VTPFPAHKAPGSPPGSWAIVLLEIAGVFALGAAGLHMLRRQGMPGVRQGPGHDGRCRARSRHFPQYMSTFDRSDEPPLRQSCLGGADNALLNRARTALGHRPLILIEALGPRYDRKLAQQAAKPEVELISMNPRAFPLHAKGEARE
jgi:hypothetical protein